MAEARAVMLPFPVTTAVVLAGVLFVSAPILEWTSHPEPGLHAYTFAGLILGPSLALAALVGRSSHGTRTAHIIVVAACAATSIVTIFIDPAPVPGAFLRPAAALPLWVAAALVPFPWVVAVLGALSLVLVGVQADGDGGVVAQLAPQAVAASLAIALSYGLGRGRLAILQSHLLEQKLEHQVLERTTMSRFIRHAAHQLRTPLTPLRLLPPSLRHHADDPPAFEKDLQNMERQIQRLAAIVERLTTLAAIEPSRHSGTADLARHARAAGVNDERIHVTAPAQAAVTLPNPAVGTLMNELVSNAKRSAHHRIELEVARHQDTWRFTIDDDGPGIPPAQRGPLLEPFGGIDLTGSTGEGTGLGLALVDAILRAGGGQLALLDSPLGGLRVQAALPVAPGT